MKNEKRLELLAPAGNMEKLKTAVAYGADAVYLGGKDYSLRSFSGNFTTNQIAEAVEFAHGKNIRVYVAVNIYPRVYDLTGIRAFLKDLAVIGPDAVIAADPGVVMLARESAPMLPVHLSTQANTTNPASAAFWKKQGIVRINVARELSIEEIQAIAVESDIGVEAFVHGAICISYSGRCLLSGFMAKRHANLGMCTHPCRWKYHLTEETRPGKYMPVAEDERGTYIFNSKDLCMIRHIPEMVEAGVTSFKIEGRMKGIHYLATVLNVYRQALDSFLDDPGDYRIRSWWLEELEKINRRGYCTGFYFKDPEELIPAFSLKGNENLPYPVAKSLGHNYSGLTAVEVKNSFKDKDTVEILSPGEPARSVMVRAMSDYDHNPITEAKTGTLVLADFGSDVPAFSIIRKYPSKNRGHHR